MIFKVANAIILLADREKVGKDHENQNLVHMLILRKKCEANMQSNTVMFTASIKQTDEKIKFKKCIKLCRSQNIEYFSSVLYLHDNGIKN